MTSETTFTSASAREKSSSEGWVVVGVAAGIAAISGIVCVMEPRFFELDLFQLLYANVFGVLGGGYAALWGNRRVSQQQEKERRRHEANQRQHRAEQALKALKETVEHNKDEIEDVVASLKMDPLQPVFSKADPHAFDPVLSRVVQMVEDLELIRETTNLRHQLEEFNRMAEAQLELFLLPDAHPNVHSLPGAEAEKLQEIRGKLIKKTVRFGKRVSKKAASLLETIERAEDGSPDAG